MSDPEAAARLVEEQVRRLFDALHPWQQTRQQMDAIAERVCGEQWEWDVAEALGGGGCHFMVTRYRPPRHE